MFTVIFKPIVEVNMVINECNRYNLVTINIALTWKWHVNKKLVGTELFYSSLYTIAFVKYLIAILYMILYSYVVMFPKLWQKYNLKCVLLAAKKYTLNLHDTQKVVCMGNNEMCIKLSHLTFITHVMNGLLVEK